MGANREEKRAGSSPPGYFSEKQRAPKIREALLAKCTQSRASEEEAAAVPRANPRHQTAMCLP